MAVQAPRLMRSPSCRGTWSPTPISWPLTRVPLEEPGSSTAKPPSGAAYARAAETNAVQMADGYGLAGVLGVGVPGAAKLKPQFSQNWPVLAVPHLGQGAPAPSGAAGGAGPVAGGAGPVAGGAGPV